jgi:TRAP-type mannitol/chloroaromatic compound transport system permease large subunit
MAATDINADVKDSKVELYLIGTYAVLIALTWFLTLGFSQWLGMVMLITMIFAIFIGFPISFTLLFLALVFGGIGLGSDIGQGWLQTFNLADLTIWGTMKDEILPAVPLFIFMGYMTEQAGLMERLFVALRSIFAPVRGALYMAVILTAAIFAMATGIVGAAVTVLGIMAGPMMIKAGYDARLSSGAIAAGGTLGVLIPPSVMLVVMGPTMGVPVNLLYSASFGPGFLLAGMYIFYTLGRSFINPSLGPPMTADERKATYIEMTSEKVSPGVLALGGGCLVAIVYVLVNFFADWAGRAVPVMLAIPVGKLTIKFTWAVVPAVLSLIPFVTSRYFRAIILGVAPLSALIGTTLGTILLGLATPTEAASCGAAGSALLAIVYGKLKFGGLARGLLTTVVGAVLAVGGGLVGWTFVGGASGAALGVLVGFLIPAMFMSGPLFNAAIGTLVTTSMVLFLAVASNVFGAIFTKLGTATVITNALVALPLSDWWKLALVMGLIFLLGWPFEWPAIILVFLPIFLPVIEKLKFAGVTNKLELLVWFGSLTAVNLQTAFLSPPVAMSAYYLRNVVPQWSLSTIYRGMADYMVIQVIALALLLFFPEIALFFMRAARD